VNAYFTEFIEMKFFKIGLKRRESEIDHLVQGGHVPNTEGSYWLALVYGSNLPRNIHCKAGHIRESSVLIVESSSG